MPTLDELESRWQPVSQDVIRAMRDWHRQHPRATFKEIETALDEQYRGLQTALANRPNAGSVIIGSGGLRKLRWATKGKGKRGGSRVIYYWTVSQEQLFMLLIYSKSEQEDLTRDQLKTLKRVVEEEYP